MSHEGQLLNDNVNHPITVAEAVYSGAHAQLHSLLKESNGAPESLSGIHNGAHHAGHGNHHLHHLELHSPKEVEQYYKKHPVKPGMPAPID